MARLRRVSPRDPGWTRRRSGRGFTHLGHSGDRLSEEEVERIKALAIPPAWTEVWICPHPNGHLQAVGTDDAGRRQYLYHPQWRTQRDALKFDRVLEAAEQLPRARRRVLGDLGLDGMPLARATAVAVRLLDLGSFRIGSDLYADAHGSFGLTTLERRHVRSHNGTLVFRFPGKSGVEHTVSIDDAQVRPALQTLRRRRTSSDRLLAFKEGGVWSDLDAASVNEYLADLLGGDLTAKDFRTWHATMLAATSVALNEEPGVSKASRRRAVVAAVDEVATYLGNTRSVARASYIDPRVFDHYEEGVTIAEAARRRFRSAQRRREALERAVLEMLREGG